MNLPPIRQNLNKFLIFPIILIGLTLTLLLGFAYLNFTKKQPLPTSEEYMVTKKIEAFSAPKTDKLVGYIFENKRFRVLEFKESWLKIKMIMPDGGDYGWEGWIRKENDKYQIVNSK